MDLFGNRRAEELNRTIAILEQKITELSKRPVESELDVIRRETEERVRAMVEDQVHKDLMLKAFKEVGFNYAIIQDLIHAAKSTAMVEVRFPDGTVMIIKDDARERLNALADELRF